MLVAVGKPPSHRGASGKTHRHSISLQDPDVVLAHLPADVGQHLVPVLELHAEGRVGKHLGDRAHHLYRVARHVPVASSSYARAACGSIVSSRGGSRPRSIYDACRPQLWQVSVTRSGASGPSLLPRRRGARTIDRVPHEGQTRGTCSRSAAIRASASGARYSFIPRRPTALVRASNVGM